MNISASKNKVHSVGSDLRGLSRLTIDAIVNVTDMAQAVHLNILKSTARIAPVHRPIAGTASLVYRSVRAVATLVGSGIDAVLATLAPLLSESSTWPGREPLLAALNGVMGDHLATVRNPLAVAMQFRSNGKPLMLERSVLKQAMPQAGKRLLVLVHGLCMNDLEWRRRGHDHGAALARDRGYSTVYLHYNSGLHISTNGRAFADQLEALVAQWPVPVEDLVILGHSMGGLVARSACHYAAAAGHAWPQRLSKMVFLGTPHHGAPLERGGNWFHVLTDISSYTAPFSSLGKIRSAGITDLRYGNLLDQDWEGIDRFAPNADRRTPIELPQGVQCYAIAVSTGKKAGDISDVLIADGLVPVKSALGQHDDARFNLSFAGQNQHVGYAMNHLDLLNRSEIYRQLLTWL